MFWNSTSVLGKLVKHVLLLQFLAVSLIPQGMMTNFTDDTLTIVICTPEGIKEIPLPSEGGQSVESTSDCVFSLHADQTLSAINLTPQELSLSISPIGTVSDSHLTSLLLHLAYGSRAPPALS